MRRIHQVTFFMIMLFLSLNIVESQVEKPNLDKPEPKRILTSRVETGFQIFHINLNSCSPGFRWFILWNHPSTYPPRQTVQAVFPHTAYRQSSFQAFTGVRHICIRPD